MLILSAITKQDSNINDWLTQECKSPVLMSKITQITHFQIQHNAVQLLLFHGLCEMTEAIGRQVRVPVGLC